MTNYIRKCSLELLAQWFCDTDLEDELQSLVKLLQDAQHIQILVNLAKDKVLEQTLNSLDELVESRLTYNQETNEPSESIFDDVVSDELATSFLYRLAKLS